MPFRLFDLPPEIIDCIIEQVQWKHDLRSLALACKRTQILAEPLLYRDILIQEYDKLGKLYAATQRRQQRAEAVRTLSCPCLSGRLGRWGKIYSWQGFDLVVSRFVNLREFSFESPECNTEAFEGWAAWVPMRTALVRSLVGVGDPIHTPLKHLKEAVIHINGHNGPYWDLDDSTIAIFTHPTLEKLTISCMNITKDWVDTKLLLILQFSTLLKELSLIECNIKPGPLKRLLSLPRALECLYLGENCFNLGYFDSAVDPTSNHLFSKQANGTLEALSCQRSSLRSLTYATNFTTAGKYGYVGSLSTPFHGSFAEFEQLSEVFLEGHCPNFEKALLEAKPPPNLQQLSIAGTVFRMSETFESTQSQDPDAAMAQFASILRSLPFLRCAATIPPHLRSLLVVFDAKQSESRLWGEREIRQVFEKDVRAAVLAAGQACQSKDIVLKVFWRPASRYFPPILYGEQDSKPALIYASDGSVLLRVIAGLEPEVVNAEDLSSDTDTDVSWEDDSEEVDEFEEEEEEDEEDEDEDVEEEGQEEEEVEEEEDEFEAIGAIGIADTSDDASE